jgi:hypothetical protein
MAGSWWRLLAAFLSVFFAAFLRGQSAGAGRVTAVPPNAEFLRYGTMPGGISTPGLPSPAPPIHRNPAPGPIGFTQFAASSGMIFSGTVTAVSHGSAKGEYATAITFKVNRAIRGVSAGQNLTIHEWAGLWSHGERYRVGEHILLFLYSPSRLGLTSPVAGGAGRFAMSSKGEILLSPQHIQIFANDPVLGGKIIASYDDVMRAVQRIGVE